MPLWLTGLIAAIRSFIETYLKRKADADAGASQQRKAQDAEDRKAADEAKARLEDWSALSPEERRRRLAAGDDP